MDESTYKPTLEEEYILLGGPSGWWSICAVSDPTNWHHTQQADACWLDLDFDGSDWVALFCDTLGVFNFGAMQRIPVHNHEQKTAELSQLVADTFEKATVQYPMLRRMSDTYEDVIFAREEIMKLREECLAIKSVATKLEAIEAISTLVIACDEALRLKYGLLFSCQ
ncbi:MAG: hypothetical protein WKF74_02995 [Pyrinomonadaceae bacterium]